MLFPLPTAVPAAVLNSTVTGFVVVVLFTISKIMEPLSSLPLYTSGSNSTRTEVSSSISTVAVPTPMVVPSEGDERTAVKVSVSSPTSSVVVGMVTTCVFVPGGKVTVWEMLV